MRCADCHGRSLPGTGRRVLDDRSRNCNDAPAWPVLLPAVHVIAAHLGIHVGEGAVRVRLPGPDMKLVEGIEPVAVGRAVEGEEMALERGRALEADIFD